VAAPSADEVLRAIDADDVVLGGGNALLWPGLDAFLSAPRPPARRIWVEAPAAAFTHTALQRLAAAHVTGICVQIEAMGRGVQLLGVGDGEAVIDSARQLGLATRARVCVRPATFGIVVPLARHLASHDVSLEILRQARGREPVPIPREAVEAALRAAPNVHFAGDRKATGGYLPPCAFPTLYAERPGIWADVLDRTEHPNRTLAACADCDLTDRCAFRDGGAVGNQPVTAIRDPQRVARPVRTVTRDPAVWVRCTAPWTTMMQLDPGGDVTQCCSDWTVGTRGDRRRASFTAIWNNASYRAARRAMKRGPIESLCLPVCPRLYDEHLASHRPMPTHGSDVFQRNLALLAEDIAEGREEARCMPTTLGFAPSTYCNYDCIMCDHGRTPRRDMPEDAWDELPRFMPTLQTLVLIGGEPLANPQVMRFLRDFDAARWPDAGISLTTNGSLLTESVLKHLDRCTFADVSVSLNAGTPEVYEQVQRGLPLATVLRNLDALVAFRARRPRPFQLRTSFVVQPASAHTLVDFGELTAARGIGIRLLPLTVEPNSALDYYSDPDRVAQVIAHVDHFAAWADATRPAWRGEIASVREAILATHTARQRDPRHGTVATARRLPLIAGR
jgi:hypothetical protein